MKQEQQKNYHSPSVVIISVSTKHPKRNSYHHIEPRC